MIIHILTPSDTPELECRSASVGILPRVDEQVDIEGKMHRVVCVTHDLGLEGSNLVLTEKSCPKVFCIPIMEKP